MTRADTGVQPPHPLRLAIAGGGRAAWAYGSSWKRLGWPIDGVWLRDRSQSRLPALLGVPRKPLAELHGDLLLVAVSDGAIDEVIALARGTTTSTIFHASGAMPAPEGGFSLHPLKALPPVGADSDLRGTLLVFVGSHASLARAIADAIGARFAEIPADRKSLYHAGAVFGSNYVAALLDIAEELIGLEDAREDIAALARSAIDNWSAHRGPERFTGPAARGDLEVIERHLTALRDRPQIAELYKLLAAEIARAFLASAK